jgi:hypothetical protein
VGVTTVNVDRIGRGSLSAKDFPVSIFGCVTPGAFGTYVREATADGVGADGFLQRLQLLVYPDQAQIWEPVDRSPDRFAEQRAWALYERLFARDEDDEQGFFNEWLKDLELCLRDPQQGWDDARRSHFAKYRSVMPAIALLCHLASGNGSQDTAITLEATARAARWCTFLEAHAERVYAMRGPLDRGGADRQDPPRQAAEGLTVRALQRDHLAGHRAAELYEALKEREQHGWLRGDTVKPIPGSRGGRPSTRIPLARR